MSLNWKKLTRVLVVLLLACNNKTQEEQVGLFEEYYKHAFHEKPNSGYYMILGSDLCGLCEEGVFESFRAEQKRIKSNKITVISDLAQNHLDTLFVEGFSPVVMHDSTRGFSKYTIPRSFITIYKVENGEIINHAFFQNKGDLSKFLKDEDLLLLTEQ